MSRYWLSIAALLVSTSVQAVNNGESSPPLQLQGTWTQGELIIGHTAPGAEVQFNGRKLRLSAAGDFVIGLDRDEPAEAALSIRRSGLPEWTARYPVAMRHYDIQRLNGLPPKQVNPEPAMAERIARETAGNRAARARDTNINSIFGKFVWPARGPITGVFGSQRILNGEPKQAHFGLDIAGPVGAPARAPMDGIISLVNPDMFFSGGTLYIDHGYGVSSAFLHLSKILVRVGDHVRQGQKIAEIGKTGRVTGPHLDWRVNWFEARLDAQRLLPPQ